MSELLGEYHKKLKSILYGKLFPKYGYRNTKAFEAYLKILLRRKPILPSRRRFIREEIVWIEAELTRRELST